MRTSTRAAIAAAVLLLAACGGDSSDHGSEPDVPQPPPPAPGLSYPDTPRIDAADTYFGHRIEDPYRWLEDIRGDTTAAWVAAQNRFSEDYITSLPTYAAVAARVERLFAPPPAQTMGARMATAAREQERLLVDGVHGGDGRFYYQRKTRRERGWPHPDASSALKSADNVIYVADAVGGPGRPLVDVNRFRIDPDDHIELRAHQVTDDGAYLVYLMTRNFSDLGTLHVVDLRSPGGPVMVIDHVLPPFVLHGQGLIYARPRDVQDDHVSPYNRQVLYHQPIGGAPEAWFEGDEFDIISPANILGRHLYVTASAGLRTRMLRLDLAEPANGVQVFLDDGVSSFEPVERNSADQGNTLLVQTTHGAGQSRLIAVDPDNPGQEFWQEILPRSAPGTTEYVTQILSCGDDYYAELLDYGSSRLYHYGAEGAQRHEIALPGPGTVDFLDCLPDADDASGYQAIYGYSSPVTPAANYRYDPAASASTLLYSFVDELRAAGYDPDAYTMEKLLVPSRDGVRIPVFLAHRKGLATDGDNPAYIHVYGGFNVPFMPYFDKGIIPLLENGGIYVVAQVRGGGELGTAWHDAGRLLNKQNTYDDVIAVAEYLIEHGYTRASRLGLAGESNGGATSAAVGLQRPDLFGAVFPGVGVLDMVRYDRFTAGFSWHSDYGRSFERTEFENLLTFSPLHRVEARTYPPFYIFTGQTDGRVLPGHSYKFAATLQNTATGPSPYLLTAFPKTGHSLIGYRAEWATHRWAFFLHHTAGAAH